MPPKKTSLRNEEDTPPDVPAGPPPPQGYVQVNIRDVHFIESKMHTLLNGSLNEAQSATIWARCGFVDKDNQTARLDRYWPPPVLMPSVDKPVTNCRTFKKWPLPATEMDGEDESLAAPQGTDTLRKVTFTLPIATSKAVYAAQKKAAEAARQKKGSEEKDSSGKGKKKGKPKKGVSGSSSKTNLQEGPEIDPTAQDPPPFDALQRTKEFDLTAESLTHFANCSMCIDLFSGKTRNSEQDQLIGTGYVHNFVEKMHQAWPESTDFVVHIEGEGCGASSPTVTVNLVPSPTLSGYFRGSQLLAIDVGKLSNVDLSWLWRINPSLDENGDPVEDDSGSKKQGKANSGAADGAVPWWKTPVHSVSLIFSCGELKTHLNVHNGVIDESRRSEWSNRFEVPDMKPEVKALPKDAFSLCRDEGFVKFPSQSTSYSSSRTSCYVFFPSDLVDDARNGRETKSLRVEFEIMRCMQGSYPAGIHLNTTRPETAGEQAIHAGDEGRFSNTVEVFRGSVSMEKLLEPGTTECVLQTGSGQKTHHYDPDAQVWINGVEDEAVVQDRRELAEAQQRRLKRAQDLQAMDPEYDEYDSDGERNDVRLEESKLDSVYAKFFQCFEGGQTSIPNLSFSVSLSRPFTLKTGENIAPSASVADPERNNAKSTWLRDIASREKLELDEFSKLVTQLGGFVLTELNKSGHHEGVDDVAEIDQLSQELEASEMYNLLRREIKTRMLRIVHERVAKRKNNESGNYIPTKQELLEILSSIKIAVDDQIATTIRGAEKLKPKTGGPNDYISLDMRLERARLSAWEAEVLREDRRAAMMHTRVVNVAKETGSNEKLAMAWNNYAAFYTRQRNFAYAMSCVENAINACPRLRSPYIIAASIRIEQGQFIDALDMLKQGESIAQDVAVKLYFEGCMAEREDIEDLEVARALQAFVYRKIGDDDRCILAINRIGNGDLDETIETQALGKPREWGLVSPDPSVTVDVLQVAAQHLVELRLGFSGHVALQMSKTEECFPSNTELDCYKSVEGNRRVRYDTKAQMIRARESPISLWASQIIMRDLTRWPPNTEEEQDEDEGETIDMLYDPEQYFTMTTFQRWQHDILLGRCINIQSSCNNPDDLTQSVEMAKTLFQGVIDAAEKAKDQTDILLQGHIHLARTYYNHKNLTGATASMEEALRIAGGASSLFDQDPTALFMFGLTAEIGEKWGVARNAYSCIVKEDKRMSAARRKVGYTNCMLGEWDEAINAFNGAVTLDPVDALSWFLLTKAHLKNKDLEAANVCFDRAVKTDNNCFDAGLLVELAEMFGQNERGKLAVTWGKAMRKANTTPSILNLTNAPPN